MADPDEQPSLVPLLHIYRDCFVSAETEYFGSNYAAVLILYHINTAKAVSATIPQGFFWQIYAVT